MLGFIKKFFDKNPKNKNLELQNMNKDLNILLQVQIINLREEIINLKEEIINLKEENLNIKILISKINAIDNPQYFQSVLHIYEAIKYDTIPLNQDIISDLPPQLPVRNNITNKINNIII